MPTCYICNRGFPTPDELAGHIRTHPGLLATDLVPASVQILNVTPRSIQRDRPHVLIVSEKWCDCRPSLGLTNSAHNLWSSLDHSGLATRVHFHYDEFLIENRGDPDGALLALVRSEQPDLILLSWLVNTPFNPSEETLARIRNRYGIPIVAIWWDSAGNMPSAERIARYVDVNIPVDSSISYRQGVSRPETWYPLWTPQDTTIFHDPGKERDIPVSFVGTIVNRPDRQAGLMALEAAGIPVYQVGGQREKPVSVHEYADILQRSRITLNFAANGPYQQLKGRVFEATLCGTLLFESRNDETKAYYARGLQYIEFDDTDDLVHKARYYLDFPREAEIIANEGKTQAQHYTGAIWWKKVLARALRPVSAP